MKEQKCPFGFGVCIGNDEVGKECKIKVLDKCAIVVIAESLALIANTLGKFKTKEKEDE